MAIAGEFRPTGDRAATEVMVAGVPWPLYKLVALAVGFMVLIIVAATTASATVAVLAAAASATAVWVGLGTLRRSHR